MGKRERKRLKVDDTPVGPCGAGVERLNVCVVVAGSTGVCGHSGWQTAGGQRGQPAPVLAESWMSRART